MHPNCMNRDVLPEDTENNDGNNRDFLFRYKVIISDKITPDNP